MKTGSLIKQFISALMLSSAAVGGASADVPALTVSNNQILSGGGVKRFVGNSFFWSNTGWNQEKMYNAHVVKWLKDNRKSTIIRVALGADGDDSYHEDPERNIAQIETVIDAAIANDMYVVIDFHTQYAENKKAEAIAFFEQMALKYGSYNHVIYEIYSEPLQNSWDNAIKPYAEDVISAIRSIDTDNLIIVGTPNSSQGVGIAAVNPIMGENIAYALHFNAGTHSQRLRDKVLTATNNGIPLVVTAWGTANDDGNGTVAGASSINSIGSRNLNISLININDLIDVGVDVDVDVDNLISAADIEDLVDNIMSDDMIDAVDQVLSSDLEAMAEEILSSDPDYVVDQILSSDLYDAVVQIGLSNRINRTDKHSPVCPIDETALIKLLDQVQSDNQISHLNDAIDLIEEIDQIQSENPFDALYDVIALIELIDQLQSENPFDTLNDVIALIEMISQINSQSQVDPANLMGLISLIALLIQSDTTDMALPYLPFNTGLQGKLFDSPITGVQWGSDFLVISR
jgi:hypothetical protein